MIINLFATIMPCTEDSVSGKDRFLNARVGYSITLKQVVLPTESSDTYLI